MKSIVFACLCAVAVAAPQYIIQAPVRVAPPAPAPLSNSYIAPVAPASQRVAPIAILRDDREHEEDGSYNFDFESEDGIVRSEAGTPTGPEGTVVKTGSVKYTQDDGSVFELIFVADENGYQPQSDLLPVAPAFPHPIPQFVLDQIAKAKLEDEEAARQAAASGPRESYAAPQLQPSQFYGQPA